MIDKFEIRSTKFETSTNFENENIKLPNRKFRILELGILNLPALLSTG
jgi:hypothetical protein